MTMIADPRESSANHHPPAIHDASRAIRYLRRMLWVYLLLLVFEGALGVALPQFSIASGHRDQSSCDLCARSGARLFPSLMGFVGHHCAVIVAAVSCPLPTCDRREFLSRLRVRLSSHLPLIASSVSRDIKDCSVGWWTIVG